MQAEHCQLPIISLFLECRSLQMSSLSFHGGFSPLSLSVVSRLSYGSCRLDRYVAGAGGRAGGGWNGARVRKGESREKPPRSVVEGHVAKRSKARTRTSSRLCFDFERRFLEWRRPQRREETKQLQMPPETLSTKTASDQRSRIQRARYGLLERVSTGERSTCA